jgi:hypothetical protein
MKCLKNKIKMDYKYLYLNLRSKLLSDKEQYLFDDTKEFIRNQEVIEFKKTNKMKKRAIINEFKVIEESIIQLNMRLKIIEQKLSEPINKTNPRLEPLPSNEINLEEFKETIHHIQNLLSTIQIRL